MKTSTMPGPAAAIARRLDWKAGDILTDASDAADPLFIRLTAIGDAEVLAVEVDPDDHQATIGHESLWALNHRDWRKL